VFIVTLGARPPDVTGQDAGSPAIADWAGGRVMVVATMVVVVVVVVVLVLVAVEASEVTVVGEPEVAVDPPSPQLVARRPATNNWTSRRTFIGGTRYPRGNEILAATRGHGRIA
jgi:hypothetical protein